MNLVSRYLFDNLLLRSLPGPDLLHLISLSGVLTLAVGRLETDIILSIDDYSLGKLISDTPSRSILLLEDIDCAFPSRDEDDDEPEYDQQGNLIPKAMLPPRSAVTLAGLLNVLDSVTSEEGRITFATVSYSIVLLSINA